MVSRTRIALVTLLFAAAGLYAAAASAQFSSPVRDVENPARTPFHASATIDIPVGFGGVLNVTVYEVPVGRRAVIEQTSVRCVSPAGNPIVWFQLGTRMVEGPVTFTRNFQIPLAFQGTDPFGGPTYVGGMATRLYADRGPFPGGVVGGVIRNNGTGTASCFVTISGHTIAI